MPWRGPEHEGEFPTLGWQVVDYIEAHCVIPDGDRARQPFILTDEMVRWFLWFYRIDPEINSWSYLHGQLVRPQKWGKGPLAAAQICAEAKGPVKFDGWDANGEPVGRPWATPWIEVTAVAEDQTDNIWRCLMPMIQLGPLADIIPDVGLQRINVPGERGAPAGLIQPVSSNSLTRLGARLTFDLWDETQNWFKNTNRGWWLADTKKRNLGAMGGRSAETTNIWNPAENSVAQRTHESPAPHILKDARIPEAVDTTDPEARRKVMRFAYGDSAIDETRPPDKVKGWVPLDNVDRVHQEISMYDRAQADRFYCNITGLGADSAFDIKRWRELARPDVVIPEGELIVVGFDGARFHDKTGLIATHVETGFQWPLGCWGRPPELDPTEEWEVDGNEVTATLADAFDHWQIWRAYCDPPEWMDTIDAWAARWGKRIYRWETYRPRQMAYAIRNYKTAMTMADAPLTHSGDPEFAEHIANAKKKPTTIRDDDGVELFLLRKEYPHSPAKIDLAVAGTISWEARGDAIAKGALKPRRSRGGGFSM